MSPALSRRRFVALTALSGVGLLAACTQSSPLDGGSTAAPAGTPAGSTTAAATGTLVVGSQAYYSNEIIAEIYAQALEDAGYTVDRQFQIGQREVYLPELQGGKIDVFPEYSGNLLQYLDKSATAKTGDEVIAALPKALGSSLRPLTASAATDQDSYNVTKANADKYGLASIADLSKVGRFEVVSEIGDELSLSLPMDNSDMHFWMASVMAPFWASPTLPLTICICPLCEPLHIQSPSIFTNNRTSATAWDSKISSLVSSYRQFSGPSTSLTLSKTYCGRKPYLI